MMGQAVAMLICGGCRYWLAYIGTSALIHIRLGWEGECICPEGECPNERGQYHSDDRAPLARYGGEPAGAHFAPIAAERTEV